MNVRGILLICSLLAAVLLCCAGCTSSQAPDSPVTTTPKNTPPAAQPAGVPAVTLPGPTIAGTPATTAPPATQVPVQTPTWIPRSYGRDATDNPQIVLLTFVKECFIFDIPDCGMWTAFPQAAADPAYGIRQPVPKLLMLNEEEIDAFMDKYEDRTKNYPDNERHIDPNTIGGPACTGIVANPKWNFVRINATLMPRNARPGEYDIGINVRSHGIIIEQLRLNRTFEIDQPVIFIRYIPLKVEEMEDFDSIELVFARRE